MQQVKEEKKAKDMDVRKPDYMKLNMAKYEYIMEQLHHNRVLNAHMRAKITQLNREKLSLAI